MIEKSAIIDRSNFVVVELPKDVVAEFFAERFQLGGREEVEQNGVDVTEGLRDRLRQ